jgi:VIT1/CCC1 family predicted Fe2+/Mn2+ transporter
LPVGILKLLIYLQRKKLLNKLGLSKWVSEEEAAEVAAQLRQEFENGY